MGRKPGSPIRSNLIKLLMTVEKGTGYELAKLYNDTFPSVSQRSIYYHLKKGCELGEFEVVDITEEKGDYSWGSKAEKIYYALGPEAKP